MKCIRAACPASLTLWLSPERYCSPDCKEMQEFGLPVGSQLGLSHWGRSQGWYVARMDPQTFLWKPPPLFNHTGEWHFLDYAGIQKMDDVIFSQLSRYLSTVAQSVGNFVASETERLTEQARWVQQQTARRVWDAYGDRVRKNQPAG